MRKKETTDKKAPAVQRFPALFLALVLLLVSGCAKNAETSAEAETGTAAEAIAETETGTAQEENSTAGKADNTSWTEAPDPAEEQTAASTESAAGKREMQPADGEVLLKEMPEDGDLLKDQTFTALIPKNRYGGSCKAGDYAEGKFLLWAVPVSLSDSGEILEKGKYAVPYIVSDQGNAKNLSMLSGGPDGEDPYSGSVWKLTTDEKGEIIDAVSEYQDTGEFAQIRRNQNAGYFVEHDGKIYYRLPKEEAMRESALFGEYLSGYCGPSEITCYDPETGKLEKLCDSWGYGKLYVFQDRLVAREKVAVNGTEEEQLILISFEDGTSEVMDKWGLDTHASMVIAMYDDAVIYEEDDVETDEYALYCLDYGNGSTIKLGALEKLGETGYPGEPQQIFADGDDLWISMSAYAGTGHFFAEARLYHARTDEEDSLTSFRFEDLETVSGKSAAEEYGADFCEEANRAPAFIVRGGKPYATEGEPGTAGIAWPEGVLMYYDNEGVRNDIASGYETFESEEEGTRVNVELTEYVNGKIFLVRNEEWREETKDVGWREAYVRKHTYCFMTDPGTGEEKLIGYAQAPLQ